MPVYEDSSIVPDSTLSSSPVAATTAIRRAARTYGRPRDKGNNAVDDSDTSRLETALSSDSRDRIYKTGPLEVDEEIPPSSDPVASLGDDAESASQDASSEYQFAWRKTLREYDEQEDFDMDSCPLERRVDSPEVANHEIPDAPTSPAHDDSSTLINDVFEGPLGALTTSPSSRNSSFHEHLSPDVGFPRTRSTKHAKRVVQDSDSEGEENQGFASVQSTSIATFPSQSSPTPSTSDEEMPALVMPKRNLRRKGRAKDRSHSRSASPEPMADDSTCTGPIERQTTFRERRKKSKVKAPTKKDVRETAKTRMRMAVDQEASIPRVEGMAQKYTIQSFLRHVAVGSTSTFPEASDADPIAEYSSDAHFSSQNNARSDSPKNPSPFKSSPVPSLRKTMTSVPELDLNDPDLPEVADLAAQENETHEKEKSYRDLLEYKKRILAAQQARLPELPDDDDDDLEVVPHVDMQIKAERDSVRKKRMSQGCQKVLGFAGVAMRAKENPPKGDDDLRTLKEVGTLQGGKNVGGFRNPRELNLFMARKVEAERVTMVRQKEAHWEKLGGKVGNESEATSTTVHEATKEYAQKGLKVMEKGHASKADEGGEEGSDDAWEPEDPRSGSRSPSKGSQSDESDDQDDGGSDEDTEDDADVTMVNEQDKDIFDDDDLAIRKPGKKIAHRSKAQLIVHSDSEDEKVSPARTLVSPTTPALPHIDSPPSNEAGAVHKARSISSFDERTEDEVDKENDTSLMWDHGENKENKAVVRHAAQHSRLTLHDVVKAGYPKSPTTSPTGHAGDENDGEGDRQPFKDLLDPDPFTSQAGPSRSPVTSFAVRLQQVSPVASLPLTASGAVAPLFGANSGGFSQFEDESPGTLGAKLLQPSFEFGTEEQTTWKQPGNKSGGLFGLAKLLTDKADTSCTEKPAFAHELGLTQDITLQPAFQIGDNLLRKADQIFEKEQEYLLQVNARQPQNGPEFYVNDHGFLTQTRPDIGSPEVYKLPSATQSPPPSERSEAQSTQRRPLRTISLEKNNDSGSLGPLQRLHKRATTPLSPLAKAGQWQGGLSPSPALPKRPVKNAFELMASAAKRKAGEARPKLQLSELVENEAQESDEDEMLGFGLRNKKDDDEEDGEDLDKTLEALVDDRAMGEDEVGADLVLEKYQEHAEKDDLEIEKLHQAAIHGELRRKKRGHGVGLEDGDEDSDVDDADSRRRRNMYKKPRIDRDNIKQLGEDPETKSFYNVYEQDLNGENPEFGYLAESQPLDVVMEDDNNKIEAQKDEEEEDEESRFVTREEIQRRIRELPPQEEPGDLFDPHNVGWIDGLDGDDEAHTCVKLQKRKNRIQPMRQDPLDTDIGAEGPSNILVTTDLSRMRSWAKSEGRSRTMGTTGRSTGGAAVTGHKVKTGGGSLRNAPEPVSNASSKSSRGLKPHKSLLAGVAAERRNTRFG